MYGLTITNDIKTQYVSQYKEIFKFKRFEYNEKGNYKVKQKKIKYHTEPTKTKAEREREKTEKEKEKQQQNDSEEESSKDIHIHSSIRVATIDSVELNPEKMSRISSEQILNQASAGGTVD